MFKFAVAALALFGLVACSTPKTDFGKLVQDVSVELVVKGDRNFCSGVLISKNEVLTAKHCVEDHSKEFKLNVQGKIVYAYLKKVDPNSDLAVLFIPGSQFENWVEIAEDQGQVGDDVYIAGSPRGILPDTLTKGIISYLQRELVKGEFPRMQMDANAAPGNSGGAAFNSRGELIGILVEVYIGIQTEFTANVTMAVPLKNIKEFLNDAT